jgi:hypothetical protein
MISRNLYLLIIIVASVVSLPTLTRAADVNWLAENYTTSVWDRSHLFGTCGVDSWSKSGPPLPISVGTWTGGGSPSEAITEITYTTMTFSMYYRLFDCVGTSNKFYGSFTANHPYFAFSYNWDLIEPTSIDNPSDTHAYANLKVFDNTSGISLFDQKLSIGSGNIYVPILSGNEIEVEFGTIAQIYYPPDLSETHGTLTYATATVAVVPEPISSTLFIVGGATLGFRRFRMKFMK